MRHFFSSVKWKNVSFGTFSPLYSKKMTHCHMTLRHLSYAQIIFFASEKDLIKQKKIANGLHHWQPGKILILILFLFIY